MTFWLELIKLLSYMDLCTGVVNKCRWWLIFVLTILRHQLDFQVAMATKIGTGLWTDGVLKNIMFNNLDNQTFKI
jgi:hypothetical protein